MFRKKTLIAASHQQGSNPYELPKPQDEKSEKRRSLSIVQNAKVPRTVCRPGDPLSTKEIVGKMKTWFSRWRLNQSLVELDHFPYLGWRYLFLKPYIVLYLEDFGSLNQKRLKVAHLTPFFFVWFGLIWGISVEIASMDKMDVIVFLHSPFTCCHRNSKHTKNETGKLLNQT